MPPYRTGKWIHDRAQRILKENKDMSAENQKDKSKAYAIATQQAHRLGTTKKNYGTQEGKAEAREKYPSTKGWKKTAEPKSKSVSLEKSEVRVGGDIPPVIKRAIARRLLTKMAAMGMDLRIKGIAGVRRPPFPTERSLEYSQQKFKKSRKIAEPGTVAAHTPPIHKQAAARVDRHISVLTKLSTGRLV